ncbi:similar to An16g04550 [Aspergillus luchuensis]|uniref:Similar to An16g04550 n=1 Tax=Aspergillus kawachii TaxID=1069201 RepID=A0A146FFP1_ASPKA|nr:similar to An16g04550 [Aspergillus luchuensis]
MASNEENLPLGRNHRMRLVRLRVSETEIDVLTEEEDDLKRPPFCMGFIHPLSKTTEWSPASELRGQSFAVWANTPVIESDFDRIVQQYMQCCAQHDRPRAVRSGSQRGGITVGFRLQLQPETPKAGR